MTPPKERAPMERKPRNSSLRSRGGVTSFIFFLVYTSTMRRLLALGLTFAGAAAACVPSVQGTRIESQKYVLAFKASPEVGKFFSLETAICSKSGGPLPQTLKVDASMPEHRHGMNYAPTVK